MKELFYFKAGKDQYIAVDERTKEWYTTSNPNEVKLWDSADKARFYKGLYEDHEFFPSNKWEIRGIII